MTITNTVEESNALSLPPFSTDTIFMSSVINSLQNNCVSFGQLTLFWAFPRPRSALASDKPNQHNNMRAKSAPKPCRKIVSVDCVSDTADRYRHNPLDTIPRLCYAAGMRPDVFHFALNARGATLALLVTRLRVGQGQQVSDDVVEIAVTGGPGVRVRQLTVTGKRPGEGQIAASMREVKKSKR